MVETADKLDGKPYWSEQYPVGRFLIRVTKGKNSFLRYQAGYNRAENRGIHQGVLVFHLLGYGETEEEAIAMAINRK